MAEHGDRVKDAAVVHNASNQRFEINIDGQLSILEYTFKNHRLFLTHTEVPPALENKGLGTKLAHAALEYARQNDLTVIAICPFVQDYVAGHPEYQSFVTTSVAWAAALVVTVGIILQATPGQITVESSVQNTVIEFLHAANDAI